MEKKIAFNNDIEIKSARVSRLREHLLHALPGWYGAFQHTADSTPSRGCSVCCDASLCAANAGGKLTRNIYVEVAEHDKTDVWYEILRDWCHFRMDVCSWSIAWPVIMTENTPLGIDLTLQRHVIAAALLSPDGLVLRGRETIASRHRADLSLIRAYHLQGVMYGETEQGYRETVGKLSKSAAAYHAEIREETLEPLPYVKVLKTHEDPAESLLIAAVASLEPVHFDTMLVNLDNAQHSSETPSRSYATDVSTMFIEQLTVAGI